MDSDMRLRASANLRIQNRVVGNYKHVVACHRQIELQRVYSGFKGVFEGRQSILRVYGPGATVSMNPVFEARLRVPQQA